MTPLTVYYVSLSEVQCKDSCVGQLYGSCPQKKQPPVALRVKTTIIVVTKTARNFFHTIFAGAAKKTMPTETLWDTCLYRANVEILQTWGRGEFWTTPSCGWRDTKDDRNRWMFMMHDRCTMFMITGDGWKLGQ